MDRINKLAIGLCSLGVIAYGTYKGISKKVPMKYSIRWIKNLTDKEWETEREIIRQEFCNPKYDDTTRIRFQNLLRLFDKVKSERDWDGKTPKGPSYYREHGYNLYKP